MARLHVARLGGDEVASSLSPVKMDVGYAGGKPSRALISATDTAFLI